MVPKGSDPNGIAAVRADSRRGTTDTWNAPSTLVGRVYFQFLSLTIVGGNLVLQSSDGTRIDCVR